ncbi:OmpP1/FadL family transporter [Nitrospira moscoviensis]|uniref:Putative long-chain fatty acid outer membrane transporter n=1 Tax=Nitrospira moscoviensis TaxID=42253 RepID=A0A0K2GIT9_NITMO|nr:outer membrane protein transport protein [Nitrospira moscoviensis]ALA60784.1 putative long-chain fatty acid outer membrane transporter [Nitrospira moscoviensis]
MGPIGRLWTAACVFTLAAMPHLPTAAFAQAFRIQGQGAVAQGQSNAFSAQADDPSAIHYNPAGITQLEGIQTSFGTSLIGGGVSYTSPTGVQASGDRGGSVAWPPPSYFYATARVKDLGIGWLGDTTLGIGLNVPFGSLVEYPPNGPFRFATVASTLPLMDIKPTIAYRFNDQLSFGLGADIYTFTGLFGEGHAEQRFVAPPTGLPGGIPANSSVELFGKDTAAGFNVSLLYTPFRNAEGLPLVNVGFVYRSQATLHLDGAVLANGALVSNATTTLVLPQVFTGAMAIWPVREPHREWKLELDVDYVGWRSNRNLNIVMANGATIPNPQNWRNVPVYNIGTEYRWLQMERLPHWEIAARAGYSYVQNPAPDATFSPAVPSLDYNSVTAGVSFVCKEHATVFGLFACGEGGRFVPKVIELSLAYQHLFYEPRRITGNQNQTVNGNWGQTAYVGGIELRMRY